MTALLREYLAPYKGPLAAVVVLLVVQTFGNLYLPNLYAQIINNGVVTGDTGYILERGMVMLGVTFAVGVASIVAVYFSARTAMAFGRDVRGSLFRTVQSFSHREVNVFGTHSLITRNTNDVQQIQMFLMMALTVMVAAPIMAIGGIVMAVRMDATLAWLLVLVIPLMALVIGAIVARAIPQFRSMQGKIDSVNRVMREQLTGIRVIRAFVRTASEQRRFAAANADLTATALTVNRLFALMLPALMLIMNLASVAIIWFGGLRVDSGEMPIGNLTAFLTYMAQILFAVMMATMMFVMIPRAAASSERVKAVLDVVPELSDPSAPRSPDAHAQPGRVELRAAEFRYPGAEAPVLADVTFTAEPGRTTAVVGSTGSGKSTLVNLIPRLYDVTGGAVVVDGVDVRDNARLDLWSRIGLVPQHAFLFGGTIASNLRVGHADASDPELWEALEVAQAADFVRALPGGLDEPVEQGGVNFSGGQRQRLAIARAIVRNPEIYIFDDSFSALDYGTDARLRAALRQRTSRATVIVVAQRVATIMHADRIVVLDGGRLVGIGRHHELMESCETYREIVLSQLTVEEAA